MEQKQPAKQNALQDFFGRLGVLGELLQFLWERKLYWLIPMILVLVIFGALILLSSNPATQPFIYTLF